MIRRERGGESQTHTSSLATGTGHITPVGIINLLYQYSIQLNSNKVVASEKKQGFDLLHFNIHVFITNFYRKRQEIWCYHR